MADKLERARNTTGNIDMDDAPMQLGPEMFGLKRVGEKASPSSSNKSAQSTVSLNRRGLPARVRKKNSRFEEDFVTGANLPVGQKIAKKEKKQESEPEERAVPAAKKKRVIENKAATHIAPQAAQKRLRAVQKKVQPAAAVRKAFLPTLRPKSNIKKRKLKAKLKAKPVRKTENSAPEVTTQNPPTSKEDASDDPAESPPRAPTPVVEENSVEAAKQMGSCLRNLLKLPKAHKWVCYEWFYSSIDQALFGGDNDFMFCLREVLPQLKTRTLTRTQWSAIRRMMGRPRRCSSAFFLEERAELARKRQKIRMIQQRKFETLGNLQDLPDQVPLPLIIGTKVTARLRQPQDGLFIGQIEAIDTSNNTYRITFDYAGIGTHSVPDYEVWPHAPADLISLSNLLQRLKPVQSTPLTDPSGLPVSSADGSSAGISSVSPNSALGENGTSLEPVSPGSAKDPILQSLGDSIQMFTWMVQLSKALDLKKGSIETLQRLNLEAEKTEAVGDVIDWSFSSRYFRAIRELTTLNQQIQTLLEKTQKHCEKILPLETSSQFWRPEVRHECQTKAKTKVQKIANVMGSSLTDTPPSVVSLITGLASLMLQIKCLAESERNVCELQALQDTLEDLRHSVSESNMAALRNHVEVHVQHIQAGLCRLGSLSSCVASKSII